MWPPTLEVQNGLDSPLFLLSAFIQRAVSRMHTRLSDGAWSRHMYLARVTVADLLHFLSPACWVRGTASSSVASIQTCAPRPRSRSRPSPKVPNKSIINVVYSRPVSLLCMTCGVRRMGGPGVPGRPSPFFHTLPFCQFYSPDETSLTSLTISCTHRSGCSWVTQCPAPSTNTVPL